MPAHLWRIEMLGGLRIHGAAQTITRFRSQHAARLLAYLAYRTHQRHLREQLLELLWPEVDRDAARNRLRVTLSSLRRQLEPPGMPQGSVLQTDRLFASLRPESFSTDVAQFDGGIDRALNMEEGHDCTTQLIDAVRVYHGDLLPEFYDEWVLQERRRLSHSYQNALHRLVHELVRARDLDRALAYALLAVQSDALNEEAHRDVMRLQVALGQPSAALSHYDELRDRLAGEMQTTPSRATRELAARIAANAGQPSVQPPLPFVVMHNPSDSEIPPAEPPVKIVQAISGDGLPVSFSRFFGRQAELSLIQSLLSGSEENHSASSGAARLVTLTGLGGAGKTRLALEAARCLIRDYKDSVWFVSLADTQDASLIADSIAAAMRLNRPRDPLLQVLEALKSRRALLVLDNLEHLAEPSADIVVTLLQNLPELSCLATSRRSLGIPGEREIALQPLPTTLPISAAGTRNVHANFTSSAAGDKPLPYGGASSPSHPLTPSPSHPLTDLLELPSIQLFLDRAQAILPDFQLTQHNAADIAELCRVLEGLPLAIELAAARTRVLTPRQILANLSRRFEILVNRRAGKDVRHRSLHAAVEWSFQILAPELRRSLANLSVFRGGWTLEAAEAVCDDVDILETLDQLRTDSLILAEESADSMRFRMLETVREFAAEHMSEEMQRAARSRHASYFATLATMAAPHLRGPDQSQWFDRLATDLDNLRAAFEYGRLNPDDARPGLELTRRLWRFWLSRGSLSEARERAAAALAHPLAPETGEVYIGALNVAGSLASSQDDYAAARALLQTSIRLAREADNQLGLAMALGNAGTVEIRSGNYFEANVLIEESLDLHRLLGNKASIGDSLSYLATIAQRQEEFDAARDLYAQSIAIHSELGDRLQIASAFGNLGLIAVHQRDFAEGRRLYVESLEIHKQIGNRIGMAIMRCNLAAAANLEGDYSRARDYFLESIPVLRESGLWWRLATVIGSLAGVEEQLGNAAEARALHAEELELMREIGAQ